MNRDNLAIGVGLAGVIIGALNWLMPFIPTRTSPAEVVFQQPIEQVVAEPARQTAAVETTTFAAETTDTSVVHTAATETVTTAPAAEIREPEEQPQPDSGTNVALISQASMLLPWGGAKPISTTAPATPADTVAEIQDERLRWTHSAGSFIDITGGRWLEKRANGTVAFRFREVSRDSDAIELHDASRDCYVRLSAYNCYVKCMWWPQQGYKLEWVREYDGGWR